MLIPQPVLDLIASIPADNPLPDITTFQLTTSTLTTFETQLQAWQEVVNIVKNQYDTAVNNVATLTVQVTALKQLLGVS